MALKLIINNPEHITLQLHNHLSNFAENKLKLLFGGSKIPFPCLSPDSLQ